MLQATTCPYFWSREGGRPVCHMPGSGSDTNLFEDGDDGQRRREHDESADDRDVQLLQRQRDRPDVHLGGVVRVLSLEEHAVGDHGEEQ